MQLTPWSSVPLAPLDGLFDVSLKFREDSSPHRVNLTLGVYCDASGNPTELPSVTLARNTYNASKAASAHPYLPCSGSSEFCDALKQLIFNDSSVPLTSIAAVQTIAGSGALRLAFDFSIQVLHSDTVYFSNPTWPNHLIFAEAANLKVSHYRYYDSSTGRPNIDWILRDLSAATLGSLVVFQPCAHNPTGADLTFEEWQLVLPIVKRRNLIPLFDLAYLGLASGDMNADTAAVLLFSASVPTMVALSCSKSMCFYGERVGALLVSLPGESSSVIERTRTQLYCLCRSMYSSPPIFGAAVAMQVLKTPQLRTQWIREMGDMVVRVRRMRKCLVHELRAHGAGSKWDFILHGQGMFTLLGISESQVLELRDEHHVYITTDARVNLAGLTSANVAYVANAICQVTSKCAS